MKFALAAGFLFFVASAWAAPPVSPQVQLQRQQAKAKYDKAVAEMKRNSDQKWKQLQADQAQKNLKSKEAYDRDYAARHPSKQLPPFNPAAAPSPAVCLRSYVAAARAAGSMEQVLPFLPVDRQQALREEAKQYDPKVAASGRAWHKQQDPKISEETLDHLTGPPLARALKWHRGIAADILEVLSTKVEGDKATIEVSTTSGGTVNGVHYPYGKATIEMLGEANYWKYNSYNSSNVIYMNPPQPK